MALEGQKKPAASVELISSASGQRGNASAPLPGVAKQGEESSAASTLSAGAAAVSRAAPAGLCVYRYV